MRGLEQNCMGRDSREHTDGHYDSMTDPAHRAESLKIQEANTKGYIMKLEFILKDIYCYHSFFM